MTLVYLDEDVLDKFNYNLTEFQDFCILCGCDYIDNIPKIGCVNAFKLINQYRSIDEIINSKKVVPPEGYDYKKVRELFSLDIPFDELDETTQKRLNKLKNLE
jgi:flap endonuclease-1